MITIKNLFDLTALEKEAILYRKGLDVTATLNDVVIPMAKQMQQQTWQKLQDYTLQFDRHIPQPFVLERKDLKKAYVKMQQEKPQVLKAFEQAYQNIFDFHKLQVPQNFESEVAHNQLGLKFVPFDSVALYVPGGKALYPSTVLMGITPAAIAKVENILLLSPPSANGQVSLIVQAVAYLAGVQRLLQAGGAQAIFAAAYGVKELEIPPVDYIYGPGNIYVAAAKNYVAAQNLCGIDGFAGPSEVIVIADDSANPLYLANDLLAQAEHDENAVAILLVTDKQIAQQTIKEMEKAILQRPDRQHITREAMVRNGKILVCENLQQAIDFSNNFAPEHLEIQTKQNDWVLQNITSAGSVFVGDYAPVALGDYFSGTNHILPTNRGARFGSGVSVLSFYKRITYQIASREGLEFSKDPITIMSKEEDLFDQHGYSVLSRFL